MTSEILGLREKRYNRARRGLRSTRIPVGVFWMRQVIRPGAGEESAGLFVGDNRPTDCGSLPGYDVEAQVSRSLGLGKSLTRSKKFELAVVGPVTGKFPTRKRSSGKNSPEKIYKNSAMKKLKNRCNLILAFVRRLSCHELWFDTIPRIRLR